MFNVGDIVWAKTHRYSVTCYHRPCMVLKCLGSEMRVLEPGDKLIHSKTKEILIFTQYLDCEYINCRNSDDEIKQYKIQDVEKARRIFYV